jgi:hypothetical protein
MVLLISILKPLCVWVNFIFIFRDVYFWLSGRGGNGGGGGTNPGSWEIIYSDLETWKIIEGSPEANV